MLKLIVLVLLLAAGPVIASDNIEYQSWGVRINSSAHMVIYCPGLNLDRDTFYTKTVTISNGVYLILAKDRSGYQRAISLPVAECYINSGLASTTKQVINERR